MACFELSLNVTGASAQQRQMRLLAYSNPANSKTSSTDNKIMSTTNYPGIDYSAGQPINRDTETGIRYGIIPMADLNPDAVEDIYSNGTDEDYKSWREEIESRVVNALKGYVSDDTICRAVDAV